MYIAVSVVQCENKNKNVLQCRTNFQICFYM